MKFKLFVLFSLLILAWWIRADAQAEDSVKPGPVILTDEQKEYQLGLHLEILEDPGGELTIEDVSSPEFDSRFLPSQVETPNYGFTKSAYWVRLHLRNEARLSDRWLLDVGFANIHFVELYTPLGEGAGYTVKQTGSFRSPGTRDIAHPHIIFNLTIPFQSEQTIYLRFQSGGPIVLPITLWQPNVFVNQALEEQVQTGMFFGIVLGLLFYHLFLFLSLRDVTYLYLVLLLAGVAVFEAGEANYLDLYLIPGSYQVKQHIIALATALTMVSIVLLHDTFLTAKKLFPMIYRMDRVLVGVWGVLALLTFILSYHDLALIMAPMIVVTLSASALALIAAWPRGFRANRALIIALLGLFSSILFFILGRLGVISNVSFTENLFRFGFISIAICWSLALADRVNKLKSETETANLELQNSRYQLAQILEGLPLGVTVYGKDLKPTYANRRVIEILGNPARGIEPDPDAGRTLDQAMAYYSIRLAGSDQKYPVEKLPIYRALQGEAAYADDAEADLVDRQVPLEIWASPVKDDAGNVESAVVALQDISARKQMEISLRASEKKFRMVVENAFDGIVFMDRDRQVLYVSPSYSRLSGFNVMEIIGQSGVGFVHPDDRARIAQAFTDLLQQPGNKTTVEYRSRHQDGSWIWVETNALNLLDDPQVQAVVLNVRNITERKLAEAELKEYQEHLQWLVEKRTAELSATNEWLATLNQVRQTTGGTADLPRAYEELFATILALLEAEAAILLRWDGQDEEIELVCQRQRFDLSPGLDGLATIARTDSRLINELKMGEPMYLSPDQAASSATSLVNFFQESNSRSLLLMPMTIRQSVIGLLAVAMLPPTQEITQAQIELVKTVTIDLASLAESARLLDQAQALVVAEERNSLARELHDSVTQILFSASMLAEATPRLWDKDQAIARMNMAKLGVLLRGALAEMRSLLLELRFGELRGQSLEKLLTMLVDAMRARTQLSVSVSIDEVPKLPEPVTQAFYRIAREALNNVMIHAGATETHISLLKESDQVKLRIQDDGHGFDPQEIPTGHLGISIMTERAAQIGGDLQIKSAPGNGTEIIIAWPKTRGDTGAHG